MSRLIDADALQQHFSDMQKYERCACNFVDDGGEPATEWYCVEDALENAPTIDAIPVEATAKRLQRAFFSDSWEAWAEWMRGNYTDEDFVAHVDGKKDAIPMWWITEKFLDVLNKDKELSKAAWLVRKAWIAE